MIEYTPLFLGFVSGIVMGSFTTAIVHRVPMGRSFVHSNNDGVERSSCPSCGHVLAWYDLIPVISWASLMGRCRYCRRPIGGRYVAIELFMGILGAIIIHILGITVYGGLALFALPFIISILFIFFRYREVYMLKSLGKTLLGILVLTVLWSAYVLTV